VVAILNCPLKSVSKALPVVIAQIIEIVRETGSTESEVVQIALKSLATILRDHDGAQAKEKDLVFLLEIISPDLEEPSRQASGFAILRAIIARKFVVPEIYDLMDRVSEIMVTNQSSQVQELCRGALLQFLLDYPQGKKRLQNQMSFLAKNLSYVYESGRKSVMELLSALVSKFEPRLVQEYGDLFFVALVMVIANDESAKCREMAAELIKSLYLRLDDGHRKVILSHLHSWASQISQSSLAGVACQVYGFVADAEGSQAQSIVGAVIQDVVLILQRSAPIVEMDGDEVGEEMVTDLDWRSPYYALVVLSKVLGTFPDITTTGGIDWAAVVTHLLYPHAWVRTASARLLGILFTSVPPEAPKIYEKAHPASLFSLIWMEDVAKKMCLQLKSEHLDEALNLQIVKNLFYVGRCFSALPLSFDERSEDNREVDNESEGGHDEEEETTDSKRQPLRWLFSNLSFQARAAHISRRNKATASVS
jgi:U3 small nucleolar RNA-associated protein 20